MVADTAAMLRMDAGRHPDDSWLQGLVDELSARSAPFRRYWVYQKVHECTDGTDGQAMKLPAVEDQTLYVYTTEPGSTSEAALRLATGRGPRPGREPAEPRDVGLRHPV